MPADKKKDPNPPNDRGVVTPEEIRRKEIAPHEGSTISPSPTGNVQDSHLPPPRRRA